MFGLSLITFAEQGRNQALAMWFDFDEKIVQDGLKKEGSGENRRLIYLS